MAEAIFNYEGIDTKIQCNLNDKIEDIITQFIIKIEKTEDKDNLFYIYNGTDIRKDLTFNEQANELDKNRKKMNIIVNRIGEILPIKKEILSKDIICPDCKENILINIKNFKINLHDCKNKHNINNILLNSFEKTQKIDLNQIICNNCNKTNKGNSHKNQFFICNNCNQNLCPLCKSIHEQNHMIINYDDKNYICKKHNEIFTKYCEKCNKDLCMICENEHDNHKLIDFKKLVINKDNLLKINKDLNQVINNCKDKINEIKNIFDLMMNLLDIYYNINNDIINNYNVNKRNYYVLQNMNNIRNNNEKLINNLRNIINKEEISELYNFCFNNFYNLNGERYIGDIKNV